MEKEIQEGIIDYPEKCGNNLYEVDNGLFTSGKGVDIFNAKVIRQLRQTENNGYTTVEQAKKLVELGVDPKTCDMSYTMVTHTLGGNFVFEPKLGQDAAITFDLFSYRNGYTIPCWSLNALFAIMPTVKGMFPHICRDGDTRKYCCCCCKHDSKYYDTPIEACIDMIEWLLENNYKLLKPWDYTSAQNADAQRTQP